jgi:hypothetical protein
VKPLLGAALLCYAAFLAVVLLSPSPVIASTAVTDTVRLVGHTGLPSALVTRSRTEFGLNALMVAPLVGGCALLWPRWSWRDWTALAFVAAGCVELGQGLFLPARSAQFVDVVANTLGALLGAATAAALRTVTRRPVRSRPLVGSG